MNKKKTDGFRTFAVVGNIGFVIITYTFLGLFLGRIIDNIIDTDALFTMIFMILGLICGLFSAYVAIMEVSK